MTKMIRKGSLRIKCKECHTEHSFDGRDMVFDKSGKTETESGTKINYSSTLEFYCKCDTKIKLQTEILEFPEGVAGNIDYKIKNGELLKKPEISFILL